MRTTHETSARPSQTPGFKLARIAGIEVHADPSWLFAIFLVVTSLAAGFARWQTNWGALGAIAVALVTTALFFLSVLAHEMAHALVARALGIPVHSITLFLFGGISNLEREPDSPRTEWLTAIVGPLMSFLLATLFILVAVAMGRVPIGPDVHFDRTMQVDPITAVCLWLGPINFVLGVFNLVPGFPLVGGRVLRALLWKATGSLLRATRIAGGIGQAIGWAFITAGIAMAFGFRVPWFGSGLFAGLWLAAIGWFLRNAAFASVRDVEVRARLAGLTVQQLMRMPPPGIAPQATIASARDHTLYIAGASVIPVIDWNGHFVGWLHRNLMQSISPHNQAKVLVGQMMTPADKIPSPTPFSPASEALSQFARARSTSLPVVLDGTLVGWLLLEDLLREVERDRLVPRAEPLWETRIHEGSSW